MNVWFVARGAGLSALLLLSVSTALGGLAAHRFRPATRYVVQYLHRSTAGLGVCLLVLHVGTILADSYAHVGWRGALVPFTSGYRPTAVALGSLAAFTFLGVALLGLARGRMAATPVGARLWRGLHGLAYAGWGLAMLHGFTSGSDSSTGWVRLLYLLCLGAVGAAAGSRLLRVSPVRTQGVLR